VFWWPFLEVRSQLRATAVPHLPPPSPNYINTNINLQINTNINLQTNTNINTNLPIE
jgi:hypothetical protein